MNLLTCTFCCVRLDFQVAFQWNKMSVVQSVGNREVEKLFLAKAEVNEQ